MLGHKSSRYCSGEFNLHNPATSVDAIAHQVVGYLTCTSFRSHIKSSEIIVYKDPQFDIVADLTGKNNAIAAIRSLLSDVGNITYIPWHRQL